MMFPRLVQDIASYQIGVRLLACVSFRSPWTIRFLYGRSSRLKPICQGRQGLWVASAVFPFKGAMTPQSINYAGAFTPVIKLGRPVQWLWIGGSEAPHECILLFNAPLLCGSKAIHPGVVTMGECHAFAWPSHCMFWTEPRNIVCHKNPPTTP